MRAHRILQYSLHQGDDGQSTRSRLKARRRGSSIHHPDTHRSSVAGRIREHSLQTGRALRPASGRRRRTTHETFWRIRSLRGCRVPGICFLQSCRSGIEMMTVGVPAARALALVVLVLCIFQYPPRRVPFPVIVFFSDNRLPSAVYLLFGRLSWHSRISCAGAFSRCEECRLRYRSLRLASLGGCGCTEPWGSSLVRS